MEKIFIGLYSWAELGSRRRFLHDTGGFNILFSLRVGEPSHNVVNVAHRQPDLIVEHITFDCIPHPPWEHAPCLITNRTSFHGTKVNTEVIISGKEGMRLCSFANSFLQLAKAEEKINYALFREPIEPI